MSLYHVEQRPGVPGLTPGALIIKPHCPRVSDNAPVVVVHGIRREVALMAELLMPMTEATGRTMILPIFDTAHWPRFHLAACKQRSDLGLLRLIAALREEEVISNKPFQLSGYSAGAQFSHRFTWLYPDLVGRICVAAPGWWTFPDPGHLFPYGMGSATCSRKATSFVLNANLKRFVEREIVVRVGALDHTRDKNLRQSTEIDSQQGVNRIERARRWSIAIREAAISYGITPNVSFSVMAKCAHSFSDCVAQARLDHDFIVPSKSESTAAAVSRTGVMS